MSNEDWLNEIALDLDDETNGKTMIYAVLTIPEATVALAALGYLLWRAFR